MKNLIIISLVSLIFLGSCSGWSEADKVDFHDKCLKAKFEVEFCDCALEKAVSHYSDFDAYGVDEVGFLDKVILSCRESNPEKE